MSMTQEQKDLMKSWRNRWGTSKNGVILKKARIAKLKGCSLNELLYFRTIVGEKITKGSKKTLNLILDEKRKNTPPVNFFSSSKPKSPGSQKLQVAIAALKAINSPESIIALQIIDEVE